MRLALLCAAAAAVAGLELQPSSSITARLLALRGGLEPQLVRPTRSRTAAATKVGARRSTPISPRRKKGGASVRKLQDMATALAVLTLVGGAQLTAGPLVESLPKAMQSFAWMAFGGSFVSGVYLLVTLINRQRARDLCNLMFGAGHVNSWFKHVVPAAYFALGAAGSMLTLPEGGSQG